MTPSSRTGTIELSAESSSNRFEFEGSEGLVAALEAWELPFERRILSLRPILRLRSLVLILVVIELAGTG
jgi:hypothetical protein